MKNQTFKKSLLEIVEDEEYSSSQESSKTDDPKKIISLEKICEEETSEKDYDDVPVMT